MTHIRARFVGLVVTPKTGSFDWAGEPTDCDLTVDLKIGNLETRSSLWKEQRDYSFKAHCTTKPVTD